MAKTKLEKQNAIIAESIRRAKQITPQKIYKTFGKKVNRVYTDGDVYTAELVVNDLFIDDRVGVGYVFFTTMRKGSALKVWITYNPLTIKQLKKVNKGELLRVNPYLPEVARYSLK